MNCTFSLKYFKSVFVFFFFLALDCTSMKSSSVQLNLSSQRGCWLQFQQSRFASIRIHCGFPPILRINSLFEHHRVKLKNYFFQRVTSSTLLLPFSFKTLRLPFIAPTYPLLKHRSWKSMTSKEQVREKSPITSLAATVVPIRIYMCVYVCMQNYCR